MSHETPSQQPVPARRERLFSLDLLRGLDMFLLAVFKVAFYFDY